MLRGRSGTGCNPPNPLIPAKAGTQADRRFGLQADRTVQDQSQARRSRPSPGMSRNPRATAFTPATLSLAHRSKSPHGLRRQTDRQGLGGLTLAGAPEGFDALVMADIARARGGLTAFVARDTARASAFIDALKFFAPEIEAVLFPSRDCLPYDRIGPSAGVAATRMATLHRLAEGLGKDKPAMLVTAAPALLQRVPAKAVLLRASYSAKVGNSVDVADAGTLFRDQRLQPRPRPSRNAASSPSAGGVIDVYPPAAEEPVRLDLFGDTLESIRAFDPETQRSTRQLREIRLRRSARPCWTRTASRGSATATSARSARRATIRCTPRSARAAAAPASSTGCRCSTSGWRRCSTTCRTGRLGEGRPPGHAKPRRAPGDVADAYDALRLGRPRVGLPPAEPHALYLTAKGVGPGPRGRAQPQVHAVPAARPGRRRPGRETGPHLRRRAGPGQRQPVRGHRRPRPQAGRGGKRVLFASWSEGSSERPGDHAGRPRPEEDPYAAYWQAAQANDPKTPQRVVLPLDNGFETESLAVISETDILGDRLARPRRRRRPQELPGRGQRPDPWRPGRAHRPRHRSLRGPQDPGRPGRAARLPGPAVRRRGHACRSRTSTSDPLRDRRRERPTGQLGGADGRAARPRRRSACGSRPRA